MKHIKKKKKKELNISKGVELIVFFMYEIYSYIKYCKWKE